MKDFRLFKRAGRDAYYFEFTFRGERYARCVETTDATDGQKRAKALYKEITNKVIRGEYDDLDNTKLRQPSIGTVEDLLEAYQGSPVTEENPEPRFAPAPSDANAVTRRGNVSSLLSFVTKEDAISAIDGAAARKFFSAVTTKALAEADQLRAASLRRTGNSRWREARSLFTPKCLEHYRQLGLYHPHMETFITAGDAAKFSGRSLPKVQYNPPRDKIVEATLTAWRDLAEHDRNLYLAVGIELSFGLRTSEVAQVQWGWLTTRNGYHCLDNAATVKSGSGWIQVKALDPFFSEMMIQVNLRGWKGEDDDYIIDGTKTLRTDAIFRAVTAWLRKLGWETQKTNHALRAYAGAQVAMKYGIFDAQQFLRHSTVKVTESHYSYFITKFKPTNADDIPVAWSTTAKVTSKNSDVTLDATRHLPQPSVALPTRERTTKPAHN